MFAPEWLFKYVKPILEAGLINELSLSIGFRYYCQFYAGAHYETETHAQLPGSKPGSQQYDT